MRLELDEGKVNVKKREAKWKNDIFISYVFQKSITLSFRNILERNSSTASEFGLPIPADFHRTQFPFCQAVV